MRPNFLEGSRNPIGLNSQKLDKIAENHAEIYSVLGPNFGPRISQI